jgi:hypothetical protein
MADLACLEPCVAAAGLVARTPGPCHPTHVVDARAAGNPLALMDTALGRPKQLLRFTAARGVAGRCEMTIGLLLEQRALAWLDEPLQ